MRAVRTPAVIRDPGDRVSAPSPTTERASHSSGTCHPGPAESEARAGTAGPRRGRSHPAGDARRSAAGPGHRRRDRRHVPAGRGHGRRTAPRAVPRPAHRRGLLLVQPHLRQRLPRPVAAAAPVHGGQPRPLDAPHRPEPHPLGAPVRGPRPARRPEPHGPADRGGLRGRARPDGLAVRGRAGLLAPAVLARLPVDGTGRLVVPAGPTPRPRRARAHRAGRAALVPVQPDLERVRIATPAHRLRTGRRRPGDRTRSEHLRHPGREPPGPRPARVLVRPPAGRPAARRPYRRRIPHRRRVGRGRRGPPRPRRHRPRARRPRIADRGGAGPGRARRAVGRLPPRTQRAESRQRARPCPHHLAARQRPGPARPRRGVRGLVASRLGLGGGPAR